MGAARASLGSLAQGAILGLALALGRAPLGLDLASTPAVGAGDALNWRACALAGVALSIGRFAGSRPRIPALFAGAALAFAGHSAWLQDTWRWEGRAGPYLVFALCAAGAWLLRPREHALLGPDEQDRLSLGERVGLLTAGAGLAIACESVARPLRLLGGGSALDDSCFAVVFLTACALGAAAFGPLLPQRARSALCPVGLALAALACLESLRPLSGWSAHDGLDGFLRDPRWKLDLSDIGRLGGDALLAARVWVLPAFALGAASCWAARGPRLGWVLFGAALALALLPALLAFSTGVEPADAPALRVALGAILAALGSALAALCLRAVGRAARAGSALACLACAAAALFTPRVGVLPISPWTRFPVIPELVLDTPGGLLTVEHAIGGGRALTLDRRRLTPPAVGEHADELRLRCAWLRVDPAAAALPERRVLLIGQLTPLRARVLGELGATHIDRSAAWHRQMERVEELLFAGDPRPDGRILSPAQLAQSGPWCLVVAPPVDGDAPVVRAQDPALGPVVVWCSTGAALAGRSWGQHVALASDGLEQFALAPCQPAGLPAGAPRAASAPWRRLYARTFERELGERRASFARLARAAPGDALVEGLALHVAAQQRSSPFETTAQQLEIDARTLALLSQAALARPPDAFLRELWNGLALTLGEKREPEWIAEFLPPLAERWAPWWQLELALARSDLELLEPGAAGERLLRVVAERPYDLDLRLLCARALSMAARPRDALAQLEAIEAVQSGRREVRRLLAMELARLGDPRAGPLLAELLAADPEDEALAAFQGSGPFPPPETWYQPHVDPTDEHDD